MGRVADELPQQARPNLSSSPTEARGRRPQQAKPRAAKREAVASPRPEKSKGGKRSAKTRGTEPGASWRSSGIVTTLAEVAAFFRVTLHTVKSGWCAGGMPGRRGHWDLAAIAEWKRLRKRDPDNEDSAGGTGETRAALRLRLDAEVRCRVADAIAKERETGLPLDSTCFSPILSARSASFSSRSATTFADCRRR